MSQQRPRLAPIDEATDYCGLSRSVLYELAPQWDGLFKKFGRRTLVDYAVLDRVLDTLPSARIRPPARLRKAMAAAQAERNA
jgi:hypothetical protein